MVARGVTALLGIGMAVCVFLLGRQLTGSLAVAVIAGSLVAISPTAIRYARIFSPDTFAAFFTYLAVLAALPLTERKTTLRYALAGALAGLAAAGKYNAALVVIAPVSAHILYSDMRELRCLRSLKGMAILGAAATLAFLALNPFIPVEWTAALGDIKAEQRHYTGGQAGSEGDTLLWYTRYLWSVEGGTIVLALYGVIHAVQRHVRNLLIPVIFTFVYCAGISMFAVRNGRALLPVLGLVEVLAAVALVAMAETARRWVRAVAGVAAVCPLMIRSYPALEQLTLAQKIASDNAGLWIERHVPSKTVIAVEAGGPILDRRRYRIVAEDFLHEMPMLGYKRAGVLIFAVSAGNRYLRGPNRYRRRTALYREIASRNRLIGRFRSPRLVGPYADLVGVISNPLLQRAWIGYDAVGAASCALYRAPWAAPVAQ